MRPWSSSVPLVVLILTRQADLEEFDHLFDEWTEKMPSTGNPIPAAAYTARAKEKLSALEGWLDGFAAEARMRAEAEEYPKARIKEERGVGFKP